MMMGVDLLMGAVVVFGVGLFGMFVSLAIVDLSWVWMLCFFVIFICFNYLI
jgi:hypothetical protein